MINKGFLIDALRQAQGDNWNTNRNFKHCQAERVEAIITKRVRLKKN